MSNYDNNFTVSDTWSIADIKEIAPALTDEQCVHVLQDGADFYDANFGYNWEYWEAIVDEYLEELNTENSMEEDN
jgi:hypothetical protein